VVLRGAGERAFVGGADINEMAVLDQDGAERFITLVHRSCAALRALPVPVIAVIRGWALGAGLELAAAADLRIAAREARFGMPEVRVGIPSVVEAALLPQLIGWGRTRWLLLTGETIDAARALEWGLVEEVARQEQLEEVLGLLLDAILAGGAHAVRIQKALIRTWEDVSPSEGIEAGIAAFASAYATDEPARMMRRFLDAAARRT
jgi:enoyl-CoA hydratase/carnithine racemase